MQSFTLDGQMGSLFHARQMRFQGGAEQAAFGVGEPCSGVLATARQGSVRLSIQAGNRHRNQTLLANDAVMTGTRIDIQVAALNRPVAQRQVTLSTVQRLEIVIRHPACGAYIRLETLVPADLLNPARKKVGQETLGSRHHDPPYLTGMTSPQALVE